MKKTTLDIPVLLPDIPDQKDQCIIRINQLLEGQAGIEKAHVKEGSPAAICIHYDPEMVSLAQVKALARQSGAELTHRYRHELLEVEGVRHQRHARILGRELESRPGILEAVPAVGGSLRIEWDTEQIDQTKVYEAVREAGLKIISTSPKTQRHDDHPHDYDHVPVPDPKTKAATADIAHEHEGDHDHAHEGDHGHAHGGIFGENTELIFSLISGALLALGFALSFVAAVPEGMSVALYLGAYAFGGYYTTREAITTIRQGEFEIDFLMLVAAIGAGILGEWMEGALLLFLFSLGHALEHYAMNRARKSIAALSDLAPPTALVKRNGETLEVAVEDIQLHEVIVVKPNSKIAVDGVVIDGSSSVNQAPITGESVPVDKQAVDDPQADYQLDELLAEHRVFAGTINGSQVLEVRVLRLTADSTLSRLVQLVKEAETQKSPTQRFTDRFERIFVPAVLILVGLLLLAFLVIDEPFSASFYRAMAVLVAASPCALAISTPSAVLAGVARAARSGVLIKGGRPLEDLGELTAVAFDKTGTLTEGRPKLTKVIPYTTTSREELLRAAVAVERLSDHPLAAAIVSGGEEELGTTEIAEAEDLQALTARGVKAIYQGKSIHIGNRRLMEELTGKPVPADIDQQMSGLEAGGQTAMIVHGEDAYMGIIAVMDVARPEAKATLQRLKEIGIQRMIMLTGDHQQVANAVAKDIGITDPLGSLLPEDKVASIERLKAEEGKVAMVGDGVNDAPAMAKSTVGIAMGAAGSDVALETADIALMADKLDNLPFAIVLSRKAKQIIRQNLWISLGMVAILVPLTITGLAEIGPAVVAHEGSTLVVVANALRLLGLKYE